MTTPGTPKVGALFAGYGGLELAIGDVFPDARPAWVAEFDAAPSRILAERFPDVPNFGDVTAVDWAAVEPVDIITGGSPCQDLSHAGKRAGMRAGTRSGLWASMCDAIDIIRPSLVVWENVRGALSAEADSAVEPCPICVGDGNGVTLRALGRVLGDLAELGYDAAWTGVRAADVGAPHGRFRVFVLAWPAEDTDSAARGEWGFSAPGQAEGGRAWADAGRRGGTPDADGVSLLPTPRATDGTKGGPNQRGSSGDLMLPSAVTNLNGDDHVHAAEAGPAEVLPGMRSADDPEAVREWAARGPGRFPPEAGMLPGLREHEGDRVEGHAPLAGEEVPSGLVPDVRGEGAAARAPHRPEPGEQRPVEPSDTVRVVPPAVALEGGPGEATCGCAAWAHYAPAIHRWEVTLGRLAPAPTEPTGKGGAHRLSPRAVEFMMGLPDGWVTDTDTTRNEQLKALGNGVVPQQAAAAIRHLLTVRQWATQQP